MVGDDDGGVSVVVVVVRGTCSSSALAAVEGGASPIGVEYRVGALEESTQVTTAQHSTSTINHVVQSNIDQNAYCKDIYHTEGHY